MVKLTIVFSSLSDNSDHLKTEQEFDYEHGLMLLLNASDVDMNTEALFLVDDSGSVTFSDSLIKKLRQLELFDIPSSFCCVNKVSSNTLAMFNEKLPFINHISYLEFTNKLSNSEQVIWI